jgi:leucyl/phenylalanyl-tRNA--protein transferase
MVLFPRELKISRSFKKVLRNRRYEVRFDTDFSAVISACAEPRQGQSGTWIHPEMIAAYQQLHAMGVAHSAETWVNGQLVGGLYGLALGRMFYGESMFSRAPDASKIAFAHLVWQLKRWRFGMIDCQMKTAHLASLGAHEIPRAHFMRRVGELIQYPAIPAPWRPDADIKDEMAADA